MYQPSPDPPAGMPALGRAGLLYGIPMGLILGVIESAAVVYLSRSYDYYHPYSVLLVPFSLLFWIIAFLIAGTLAGKRTGKVMAGMLAGLWAALAGGFMTVAAIFAMLVPFAPYNGYSPGNVALSLTFIIVLLLGTLGVGTGLGALGGLIGQSFAVKITVPVHQRPKSDPPHVQYSAYRASESNSPLLEQEQIQYQRLSDSPRQE